MSLLNLDLLGIEAGKSVQEMPLTFFEVVENMWRSCQEVLFSEEPVQSIYNDHLEPTYRVIHSFLSPHPIYSC